MKKLYLKTVLTCVCLWLGATEGPTQPAAETKESPPTPSDRVVAFYYPWYGNPGTDGRYANWNHPVAVRKEPPRAYPGGDDIGSDFYPSLGCYSVNDPEVLREHMRQLRQAGVGVICASWWGKDTFTDRALPALFKAAERAGLLVNFHIEPFPGRNAATTREALAYLIGRYGASPACHRLRSHGNRPVFFVYDSYLTPASDWATILTKEGKSSIRGTGADAIVMGLWVKPDEERFMVEGGFDGFYTYFATDGFTFGSTTTNWPGMAAWARAHDRLFVPSVAPGYIDTRIRPWNGVNTRDREAGAYYDRMWSAALKVTPELIGITSFNEWHEGTQIEKAVPKRIQSFTYLDYQPLPEDHYLDRTAHWVRQVMDISRRPLARETSASGETSLINRDLRYTVPEKPYIVLRRGHIEAVIVDNRAVDDSVLPGHAAGYHGIGALRHTRQLRSLFVPKYAGLNFEHIHDGSIQTRPVLFEPRQAPMELRVVNDHTAELYQAPTPHWGLESCMRYELLSNEVIEVTFECVPRRDMFKNGYCGLFWASYIDQPESLDIHFRGLTEESDTEAQWKRGVTPKHGTFATHRGIDDQRVFRHDPAFPLELPFGFSRFRYAEPWYFGVCRDMALVLMFRPADRVWLSQSPSGGGSGCPAWDFQWFISEPRIGQVYRLKMRVAYVPLEQLKDIAAIREQISRVVERSGWRKRGR